MTENFVNRGVILGQRPEDWQAGSFTFIAYEKRNPSGDWRPYLPVKEIQYGKEDSLSCVSFSAINAIEIQEKFLTGFAPNYSDRWIAKRSGTTTSGNYLYKVGDTIRKEGLVLESDYPAPPNYTFAEYHADIPQEKLDLLTKIGQQWLSKWDFKYEFIPATKEAMIQHIKHAPLQIVVPGHAIVNFLCEDDIAHYFDTYNPHEKTTPYANVQTALKPLISRKIMSTRYKVNKMGKLGVLISDENAFSDTIYWAKSMEMYARLLKDYEIPDDAQTINFPS